VRVDLGVISEDLRQRVLTAIASELERDEAERRRNAQEQDGAGGRGSYSVLDAAREGEAAGGAASPANGSAAGLEDRAAGLSSSAAGLGGGAADLWDGAANPGDVGAAAGHGESPANGSGANTGTGSGAGLADGGSTSWDHLTGSGPDYGTGASPVSAAPWDRDAPRDRDVPSDQDAPPEPGAPRPGAPAQQADTPDGETADRGHGAAEDARAAQEPAGAAAGEEGLGAGDAAADPDAAASRPGTPLPRRAPGTNGAPPPPSELRRDYLPPSLLGRRLDPEAHTEPLPRISATGRGSGAPAATGSGRSAPSIFSPASRVAPPSAAPAPAGSPTEPGPATPEPATPEPATPEPAESGPSGATSPGEPAEFVPSATVPAEAVPPDTAPPRPAASASALAAASAPTMPVGSAALAAASAPTMPAGSAALAAASAPTMPAGSAALAAAAAFAPPAKTAQPGADLPPPADPAAPSAGLATAPADRGAPPPVPPPLPAPSTSARSRPPAASLPAPSGYGRPADPAGPRPPAGRGAGSAVPLPAALPAAERPSGSGRPYRIAGVILAVVALVVAAVIALVLSGGNTPRHGSGLGPPSRGAGALARKRAAAWVAGQVSPAAVVACDPAMCQALMARGVPANRLYQLGPQITSPLRSQVIVATAAVRAQFGNVLSSVYAPAVLASFGSGPGRVDIRATAQHGAAAYRALLSTDMASRKASGTQLLHSGRITAAAAARHELAAGDVDGRLLVAIAQMAAAHPMFIVDFGSPAPGADPDVPLRQADLAADAHTRHHAGHAVSAGLVRSMLAFLHAQHGQFRPARVQMMRLPDGAAVLRIEFTAPSPLGLLGPRA
jgi:hypothetical protein